VELLAASDRGSHRMERLCEATRVLTRILRLALRVEESRSYWEHVEPAVPNAERSLIALVDTTPEAVSPALVEVRTRLRLRVASSCKRCSKSLKTESNRFSIRARASASTEARAR
jgi:hypothetical protein